MNIYTKIDALEQKEKNILLLEIAMRIGKTQESVRMKLRRQSFSALEREVIYEMIHDEKPESAETCDNYFLKEAETQ